ncbi:GNAT family N-acetyltransferase [Microbispora cellulosiformans]|uniref:GNAT family N-acetyltransferase n=1 Tax=Microbispora cellulosiformans TaxID=2614688 RepID=A0A5J5JZ92_9ACTN|nr:GNAT family N-acetyltransferase [Microbispora cellulosiformans]KAA9375806.1 GNAT family N-acetyltransferase [Microbispora cellulosiformans]
MHIERVAAAEREAGPKDGPEDSPKGLGGLYEIARVCALPGPAMSWPHFVAGAASGSSGERTETWVARDGGQVAGGHILRLPSHDNTHVALLQLMTHPGRRREGIGGALLDHAIARARAEGRSVLVGEAPADGPGSAFANARGFSRATTETRLVLDLPTADWSGLELLRARAVRHATGYSLERWAGPTPADLLDDMARLNEGMNDEPLGDLAMEDQRWTAERVRARDEMLSRAGQRTYTVIARHLGGGGPAAYTQLMIDAERPEGWVRQSSTAVLKAHRGRRLGLVLKLANLMWLRACEPSAERVITWNSVENPHMRAINETIGFEVFDTWHGLQLAI